MCFKIGDSVEILYYEEGELEGVLEERPSYTSLYDPVSLG